MILKGWKVGVRKGRIRYLEEQMVYWGGGGNIARVFDIMTKN